MEKAVLFILLLEDELARREQERMSRRVRRARFESVCDLRDFDFAFNPEIPKARLWELASGRYLEEHASEVLCGPTGVGKTFVVQALGIEACRFAVANRVLITKSSALPADLAGGRADSSWPTRLNRYLGPDLLIPPRRTVSTDDFGRREYTAGQTEDLYEVVSRGYGRKSLVVTRNRKPEDLYALFPNPVSAEGQLDRLLKSAFIVPMTRRSYRRQRPGPAVDYIGVVFFSERRTGQ